MPTGRGIRESRFRSDREALRLNMMDSKDIAALLLIFSFIIPREAAKV
jgi:hypothetical protein